VGRELGLTGGLSPDLRRSGISLVQNPRPR
jgi:hypothetical protein